MTDRSSRTVVLVRLFDAFTGAGDPPRLPWAWEGGRGKSRREARITRLSLAMIAPGWEVDVVSDPVSDRWYVGLRGDYREAYNQLAMLDPPPDIIKVAGGAVDNQDRNVLLRYPMGRSSGKTREAPSQSFTGSDEPIFGKPETGRKRK